MLFFILVIGGAKLGRVVGRSVFGRKNQGYTFIDNSVHHHHHNHEHKNINIIDEETHRRGLEKFNKNKE